MKQPWIWTAAGSILLLSCLGWTLLSGQFQYGEGHADRPILEFLALYFLAWAAFVWGCLLLSRNAPGAPWKFILAAGLLARVVLLPSNLIQENDVYRYVLDGQALRHGVNPFRYAPLVVTDLAPEPFSTELRSPEAKTVLSRVGYPHISTIYPPAAQVVFSAGAWLGGWDWKGQRWLFLAADVGVTVAALYLLHLAQLPLGWILLYAWNPLVLKEVTNAVHVDVWAGLFLLLTLVCLARQERTDDLEMEGGSRHSLWAGAAGGALGLAVLVKLYPILLLPAAVFFLRRRSGQLRPAIAFAAGTLLIVLLGFVPFMAVGFARLTAGLSIYAGEWVMNAGAFSLLSRMFSDARPAAALLIGSLAVSVAWRRDSRQWTSLVVDFQWALLLWFLFIPTPFPWYAVGLIALLPLNPGFSAPSAASIFLSGAFGLYYLSFFYEYHRYSDSWWTVTRAVEHGVVWGVLVAVLVRSFPRLIEPPLHLKTKPRLYNEQRR